MATLGLLVQLADREVAKMSTNRLISRTTPSEFYVQTEKMENDSKRSVTSVQDFFSQLGRSKNEAEAGQLGQHVQSIDLLALVVEPACQLFGDEGRITFDGLHHLFHVLFIHAGTVTD